MDNLTERTSLNIGAVMAQLSRQKSAYTWRVVYQDGTTTDEYDESRPDGRGWAEREAKKVATITLAREEDGTEVHSIDVPEDAEPVFFRRRTLSVNLNSESVEPSPTTHCIGWTRGNEALYLFVFESGETLLTDNLQAV